MPNPGRLASLVAAACLWTGCQGAAPPESQSEPAAPRRPAAEANPAPSQRETVPAAELPATVRSSVYASAAAYSEASGGHALLIVEGDRVVLAVGQNGHAIDAPHPLYNATESFWGPVAVAAEIDGFLDLDEPVAYTIDEWNGVQWKDEVRIRQLLHYTSGLESGLASLDLESAHDHYTRALSLRMVAPPGVRFQFGPSHLAVFGATLGRLLDTEGIDPLAYLKARILDPIGVEVADWERDAEGNPGLSTGATLRAHEWAKFGRFVRDGGRFGGAVVIAGDQLAACFEGSDRAPSFGLTFWLNTAVDRRPESARLPADRIVAFTDGDLPDLILAAGTGNQRLYAIPSLDLVVVRFGETNPEFRDRNFLAAIVQARAESVRPSGR